ncbi:isopeptide-forming domain-containing fimbrial protein [Thermophilibacter mediterraneus]|uniref:isopeptide-forming domain-containing fimbrial protein n=1 Tax=Thermophilibacter mediterraneus TaxID=1871031 RepID=UPI0009308349|nr:isopeptide-forming domain-containing fimbrial protein [Thermophilibacter mediterraneus]
MNARKVRGTPRNRSGAGQTVGTRVRALLMTVALVLSNALGTLFPIVALADPSFDPITVSEVSEDEFEAQGYSWSINFSDVDEGSVTGFVRTDDISRYISTPNALHEQYAGSKGYYAPIDASTPKGSFSLRYTGGSYGEDEVDAVVTLTDWTFVEPLEGWDRWPYRGNWETFQTGVFMIDDYKTPADEGRDFENFNFYTVGLDDLEIEVKFVFAGTDTPIPLKGHITTTDLDRGQSFSFGGSATEGRITSSNDRLGLNDDKTAIVSDEGALSETDPEQYRLGLCEAYFDSTSDNAAGHLQPLRIWFGTSWRVGEAESIFSLSSEFLTLPDPNEPPEPGEEPVKSVDRTEGVSVGDEVTYTIDFKEHEQGVNCRVGYHYTALDIVDVLPAEMRYVDGSGYLVGPDGSRLDGAGRVVYEGDNENPTENTVRFEFDRDFLPTMAMSGERYQFVFRATLTEYPANGNLYVRNTSYALINGTGKVPSNTVQTDLLQPVFSVDKVADGYEWEVGDVVSYTVTYRQTVRNAQSRDTVVSDNLPEYLELLGDTVRASGVKDLPAVEVNGNEWSLHFDKFNYGDELVVSYQARVRQSGNGREIVNNAGIHANNAMDADDPEEIYANTANVEVTKDVDRFEGYVGASDQDPGFFEYTVHVTNAQEGTVANGVTVTDDTLPEGMRLGRNADGSLMVLSLRENGSDVAMSWVGDRAEGVLSPIQYRIADDDHTHDQYEAVTPAWSIEPSGTGWKMSVDHLAHGTDLELVFRAYPEDGVSGWEIENRVTAEAANSQPDDDMADVWVNQPHLTVEKEASNDTFTVNDVITYHVRVTNSTPGTLGRDLVISDLARTQGVELLRDSIRAYDSRGEDITESCTVTYRHAPQGGETFILETNRDLVCAETSRPVWADGALASAEGRNPLGVDVGSARAGTASCETEITVEYRVQVQDSELAGKTVENTAHAETSEPNTATTDDEVVDVKGPRLDVEKDSDRDVYQEGETGRYTVVVSQTREDCEARGVVVTDRMDEAGVGSIVEGSVVVTGPDGAPREAQPEYVRAEDGSIVGFTLATGIDLVDEQQLAVSYDVSMLAAGTSLHNVAQASAEGSLDGTDDNTVEVVAPRSTVEFDKTVDRDVVRMGEWATYTLTASVADNPARNVVISDKSLPEAMPVDLRGVKLEVNGAAVDDFELDVEGNGFAARLGDLEPGDVATITYRAQARDEGLMGTSVVNTAELTADTLDGALRDDAHVTVPADAPEVTLTKVASVDTVAVGEPVAYTVEASVPADGEGARNVVVGDASLPGSMPIDMSSIRAWLNDREIRPVNADIAGNTFSVAFGDLRPGETVRITYDATPQDEALAGSEVENVATLTSESLDEPLSARETVRVAGDDPGTDPGEDPGEDPGTDPGEDPGTKPGTDPGEDPGDEKDETTLSKSADRDEVAVGDEVAYTVTIRAAEGLEDATLSDTGLPDGVRIAGDSLRVSVNGEEREGLSPIVDGTSITLELGALDAGDEVTLSYRASVTGESLAGETLVNMALLESASLDEPLDATATVDVVAAGEPDRQTTGGAGETTGGGGAWAFPNTGQSSAGLSLIVFGLGVAAVAAVLRIRQSASGRRRTRR